MLCLSTMCWDRSVPGPRAPFRIPIGSIFKAANISEIELLLGMNFKFVQQSAVTCCRFK